MNNCGKYRELISLMLDRELPESQKTELEAHISACRECTRLYDAFAFISFSIDEGLSEPPETLCADIMENIRTESFRKAAAKKRTLGLARLAALAACLAIVVFAASRAGVTDLKKTLATGSAQSTESMAAAVQSPSTEITEGGLEDTSRAILDSAGYATVTEVPFENPENEQLMTYGDTENGENSLTGEANVSASPASSASLLGISKVTVFSGETDEPDPAPILTVTDEDSLIYIMDLLGFSVAGDEIKVTGAPVFIIEVTRNDDTVYSVSVWVVDGRLCCVSDADGVIYVAAGNASDLFSFIAAA